MSESAEEREDIVERLEEEADRFDLGARMDRDEHPLLLAEAAECIRQLRSAEAAAREEERERCRVQLSKLEPDPKSIPYANRKTWAGRNYMSGWHQCRAAAIRALAGEEGKEG